MLFAPPPDTTFPEKIKARLRHERWVSFIVQPKQEETLTLSPGYNGPTGKSVETKVKDPH